jgi:three-Cys-motif partner protein
VAKKLSEISKEIDSKAPLFRSRLERMMDADVISFLNDLSEVCNLYIFSGVIRDYFLNATSNRDIDIVFDGDVDLEKFLANYTWRKNSFGGYKIAINEVNVDMWKVSDTWALGYQKAMDYDLPKFIPNTAFFNFSSIVFHYNKTKFYHTPQFAKFIRDKEIDITYYPNANIPLCVVNSFYYSDKLRLPLGDTLVNYIKQRFRPDEELYEKVQLKHFGKILYDIKLIKNRISELHAKSNPRKEVSWGGVWTERKLEAFAKYVWAYLKILKSQAQWKTIYFDGFAGSGERTPETSEAERIYQQLSLTEEEVNVYKGAAERVLTLPDELVFDYHYFIDKSTDSLIKLKTKLESLDNAEKTKLVFKDGDCNKWLAELANALKTKKRFAALVLLDPFGMQINWSSIANFKGTRSDVWILVPTGVIINRLLYRSGKLEHVQKLESFFGLSEQEIKKEFYKKQVASTLFGEEEEVVTKVVNPIGHIMNLYIRQLKTIWKHVTEEPLRLDNSQGRPLFHLVFASNNATALKIAKQIITSR